MKDEKKTKIAIIGLGNIGQAIATNLVKNNRSVIVAAREIIKANSFSEKLGNLAKPMGISDAIKEATIIIPAIWFNTLNGFFNQYANELHGKIIIDVSNPIAPDGKGGFTKIIGENESAGELNAKALPKNVKFAKTLGTLGATSLLNAANQSPERAVLFYATDDTSIKGEIEELIIDNGFEPVGVGGLNQSIRIEVFGDLHEFGALGRTVTRKEIESKIKR
ncbi:MAG TPA: NADP oxidoreductase coenzyme F420-dependent [Marinilabiliales bacterium]|nr:NADP oxidoreductase coenzyme F420-dependent [Marinilabiliales bacterium]